MLSNIYYIFGVIVLLALIKMLLSFKKFYTISEWFFKFEKVTGKKPLKSEFRTKEDFNNFERRVFISATEFIWILIGIFSSNWIIFLSVFIGILLFTILSKPIKFNILHMVISFLLLFGRISIYCYLILTHFLPQFKTL